MREKHIRQMLSGRLLQSLTDPERRMIETHIAVCSDCRRAYDAANISDLLIHERAGERVEPVNFFSTRVMARVREGQLSTEVTALRRLWQAAGALISAMATLVVILAVFSIFTVGNEPQRESTIVASAQTLYSPENLVLGEGDQSELPYDQVLVALFEEDSDGQ